MNAPAFQRRLDAHAGTLHLFALFHLNLAFSSIEEEQRADVVQRCYWPLLALAEKHGPIGIEATGYTLEEIARIDPAWIAKARTLIADRKVEWIGSGYSQMIGPLVPWRVTQANLRLGNDVYNALLGIKTTLALVNEQAYSAGLVSLYLEAGYRAILMDWDNCAAHHPEWPAETRYLPQTALGADGRAIGLLWTNTVAFQKLQRFAHDDIGIEDYIDYLRGQRGQSDRTLCLYASDAEIFDYRPGRYRTEEKVSGGEWERLERAFASVTKEKGFHLVAPSEALWNSSHQFANQKLSLESAACPVPVKKQRKYNLSRWAVTGRDDIAINAACERIYRGMNERMADDAGWKELCYLWASDFRTHITDRRWSAFVARLDAAEQKWAKPEAPMAAPRGGQPVESRRVEIETANVSARLDRRRGLAMESLRFAPQANAIIGGLPHGHFDDIALQADWYTGDCVFEAPGEHKTTDLEWCDAVVYEAANGDRIVATTIATPRGPIEKTLRFCASQARVDFELAFHWDDWGRGSLRLGHITLLPDAFDWQKLTLTTHNGGKTPESFSLADATVDHGAPVSFLVSASHGIGMTEGWAEIGDGRTRFRVSVDRGTAPLLGLLSHRRTVGSLFCQLILSALELDETRKPFVYRKGPRKFRFSIAAA
ncbi:MAG TPA: hypothetical protein VHW02_15250 [Rhizomicrobium sp.]|jgi:hypothetical protein|nr:hypothetical protein [Rhizomicrobium sp.]